MGVILAAVAIANSLVIYNFQSKADKTQLSIARQNSDASAIQIFTTFLPSLRAGEKEAEETYGFIANRFQNEYGNPFFAELLLHLQAQNQIKLKATTVLQLSEATVPAPQNSASANWTAVVHSYQAQNRDHAQRGACRTILALRKNWPKSNGMPKVEIFLTEISNSLAVTVGGFVEEADARATAKLLRENGIKDDAFVQVNRNWSATELSGETLINVRCRP